MLEGIRGSRPAVGALSKERPQEVSRLAADTDAERKLKSLVFNFTSNLVETAPVKRRLASEEHIHEYPHGPDVTPLVVRAVDHLRSHKQWRACKRLLELVSRLSKTEVDKLEGSLGRKKNVVGLDVPMHEAALVAVSESL